MTVLLVITTGHSDVQVLDQGERREFHKDQCAALHAQLAQRQDWDLGGSHCAKSSHKVTSLPEDAFQLCTPKLDAVLDHASAEKISITTALVLETRRDPKPGKDSGDPGQAGTVVARRLREKLGVDATLVTYLSGTERLEDRDDPYDAVIRREVVTRIRDACHAAIERVKPTSIIVAATGGFPIVGSLVEQIVRLYGGKTPVQILDVPDASRTGGGGFDRAVPRMPVPSPPASFEARRHALELIRGGHLLGAWGAVRHLHDDPVECRWTTPVEWLSLWASSLPLSQGCDIELLGHPRKSVRAALRVELALFAGDIPDAVHGTVAFFEAAVQDHLVAHPSKPGLYSANPPPSRGKAMEPFQIDKEASKGGTTWYRVKTYGHYAFLLAEHYLKKPDLEKLAKVVWKVRDLRNDVAHNVPTLALMENARQTMQDLQLWSANNLFTCQELVAKVLIELGVANPESLRSSLIHEIEKCLLR